MFERNIAVIRVHTALQVRPNSQIGNEPSWNGVEYLALALEPAHAACPALVALLRQNLP
jgi:hypothetical protein